MSLVEVKNLNKKFGKKQVLHDVNFVIDEGEILGFIGPNGAGKTTTIKLMLGLQSITSGSVTIDGYDIVTDFEKAINGVGAIVESPDLYMYLLEKYMTHQAYLLHQNHRYKRRILVLLAVL